MQPQNASHVDSAHCVLLTHKHEAHMARPYGVPVDTHCRQTALTRTRKCSALGREEPGLRVSAASALSSVCARLGTRLPVLLLHSGLTPSVLEYVGTRAADNPRLLSELARLVRAFDACCLWPITRWKPCNPCCLGFKTSCVLVVHTACGKMCAAGLQPMLCGTVNRLRACNARCVQQKVIWAPQPN